MLLRATPLSEEATQATNITVRWLAYTGNFITGDLPAVVNVLGVAFLVIATILFVSAITNKGVDSVFIASTKWLDTAFFIVTFAALALNIPTTIQELTPRTFAFDFTLFSLFILWLLYSVARSRSPSLSTDVPTDEQCTHDSTPVADTSVIAATLVLIGLLAWRGRRATK
jgi:hypothetical protein